VPQDGSFRITRTDGSAITGRLVGLDGDTLAVEDPDGERVQVPFDDVLALAGPPPTPAGAVRVLLVGGDELTGDLVGGDAAGETFRVRSGALGPVDVVVDRLRRIEFVARAEAAGPRSFEVPEDARADEALFRPADRAFDVLLGALWRFGAEELWFAVGDADEPRAFPYAELSAVALRGGIPAAEPPEAWLLTRTGDRVGGALETLSDREVGFRLEGGTLVGVPLSGVSALVFRRAGVRFLSDLEPEEVVERSWFADADVPLWRYRRDRNVVGGPLVVGDRTFVKGLGVHARSVLRFRVPEDASAFHALVGIDDSVLQLGVRGIARIAVRLGDEDLVEPFEVRSGEAPTELARLPVEPGAVLTLEADFGPGLDLGDRVDWLQAAFLR